MRKRARCRGESALRRGQDAGGLVESTKLVVDVDFRVLVANELLGEIQGIVCRISGTAARRGAGDVAFHCGGFVTVGIDASHFSS